MNKTKRLIGIIRVLLLIIAVVPMVTLSGCNKQKKSSENNKNTIDEIKDEDAEQDEETDEDADSENGNATDNGDQKESLPNFDEQYIAGEISADEYVMYRLDSTEQAVNQMDLLKFVDQHFDELSDETLACYYDKICLDSAFPLGQGIQEDMRSEEQAEKKTLTSLFMTEVYAAVPQEQLQEIKILTSSDKRFMVWYTTKGEIACTEETAQMVADTFEATVSRYDELFETDFRYQPEVVSKGEYYEDMLKVLAMNGFSEQDLNGAMQIYLGNYHAAIATYNGLGNGIILRIMQRLEGMDQNGTLVLPYVIMDATCVNKDVETTVQVCNHELFHHYQYAVLNDNGAKTFTEDEAAADSTANWASSLVTDKTDPYGYLNDWAAVARKTPNLLTDEDTIQEYTTTMLSYAYFPYLYEYSQTMPDGIRRVKDAMYEDDFFGSLSRGINLEDLNDLQEKYIMHLLNQDYDNMNLVYNPNEAADIEYRKIYDFEKSSGSISNDVDVKINPIGVEYYKLIPDGKNAFTVDFYRESETVAGVLIGEKDGVFTELDAFDYGYDTQYLFSADGLSYDTYYFAVGNSSMKNAKRYTVQIKLEKIEEGEEPSEESSEDGTGTVSGGKTKAEEAGLFPTGSLTFRNVFSIDDEVKNAYTTYYYKDDTIVRIVFTTEFTEDASEEGKNAYEQDVKDNPRMYKKIYLRYKDRLVCEYSKEMVEQDPTTFEDLLATIQGTALAPVGEYVETFIPEL